MCIYVKHVAINKCTNTWWSFIYGKRKEKRQVPYSHNWIWICKWLLTCIYKSCVFPLFLCRHTSDRVLPFSTLVAMPMLLLPLPPGWPKTPKVCSYWWAWWKPPWSPLYEVNTYLESQAKNVYCSVCALLSHTSVFKPSMNNSAENRNYTLQKWYPVHKTADICHLCWLSFIHHSNIAFNCGIFLAISAAFSLFHDAFFFT